MERVRWIEHKGRKILFIDYTNLRASDPAQKIEIRETLKKLMEIAGTLKEKTLFLTDATNAIPDKETLDMLKKVAAFTNSNRLVEKECIVGLASVQHVLMNVINFVSKAKLSMFDSTEKALEWLTKE
jgi:hypothetical protein